MICIGRAAFYQEMAEGKILPVQRVHKNLAANATGASPARCILLALQNAFCIDADTRPGHNHDLLLKLFRRREKYMHQIRRLRVRGYDQLGLRREAVFRLRPMGVQANKKIAAYAAGQQRLHQPGEHRHAHDPLQKHRPFIACLSRIIRDKNHCGSHCHRLPSSPAPPAAGALSYVKYSKVFRFCIPFPSKSPKNFPGFRPASGKNKIPDAKAFGILFGDPYGTRTHVTAVKGRCLNHLTNGPGSGNLI